MGRGPGAAPLTWGEESEGSSERFAADALPAGRFEEPNESALLGVATADPDEVAVGESGGLVPVAGSEGATAWQRRIAPRHRSAVRSFFAPRDERSKKNEEDQ